MKIITYVDKYKDQVIKLIFDIAEIEIGIKSKRGRPDIKNIQEFYQKNAENNFWIAIDESDNVIGTVGLLCCGNGNGELNRMYVRKDMRRQGVATKLLAELLNFAKKNHYKTIYLSTFGETGAKYHFYKNSGFERVESVPEGIDYSLKDKVFYKLEIR